MDEEYMRDDLAMIVDLLRRARRRLEEGEIEEALKIITDAIMIADKWL